VTVSEVAPDQADDLMANALEFGAEEVNRPAPFATCKDQDNMSSLGLNAHTRDNLVRDTLRVDSIISHPGFGF
jgi:hypothetical protein